MASPQVDRVLRLMNHYLWIQGAKERLSELRSKLLYIKPSVFRVSLLDKLLEVLTDARSLATEMGDLELAARIAKKQEEIAELRRRYKPALEKSTTSILSKINHIEEELRTVEVLVHNTLYTILSEALMEE